MRPPVGVKPSLSGAKRSAPPSEKLTKPQCKTNRVKEPPVANTVPSLRKLAVWLR
jgi:hypothetical protein